MKWLKNRFTRSSNQFEKVKQLKISNSPVDRRVTALYDVLGELYGSDQLILRAGKLDALHLIRSSSLGQRVLGLERLIDNDPTIEKIYNEQEILETLDVLEDKLADLLAKKSVEEKIERKINERLQERHQEYVREIRAQVIKEETGADNARTLKKYAELEILEAKKLSCSALEMMRPTNLSQVIGQEQAIKAMLTKLSSPFPQHIIIYGPPGVGKTTAARLALEHAKQRKYTPFDQDAPFIEVDGTTLRWDPREVTNPLLGSVHDPIYQGAKRDLADGAIPEPKLGLVTEAHGGVLFIDEIGELEPMLQNKLLKVLEDKRVTFESAYYDPDDPNVPKYIKKLFEEGAPADFILIGATTRDPSEINPALRSRCAEIFFEPLEPKEIQAIAEDAAKRLNVKAEADVYSLLSDYTIEGRQATRLLADAYSVALYRSHEQGGDLSSVTITREDLLEVLQAARLTPYATIKGTDQKIVGKIFGLGVVGYLGSLIEIEAVAFSSSQPKKGVVRFNDTAGSMAKDSVFNAASVFRYLTGEDLANFDIHVNVVGGGQIDGPSAGAAIFLAIYSACKNLPIPQNITLTGEISLQGKIKPVGGVQAKIYGARQAGIKKVFIPRDNFNEIDDRFNDIEIIAVDSIEEIIDYCFPREIGKRKAIQSSVI